MDDMQIVSIWRPSIFKDEESYFQYGFVIHNRKINVNISIPRQIDNAISLNNNSLR